MSSAPAGTLLEGLTDARSAPSALNLLTSFKRPDFWSCFCASSSVTWMLKDVMFLRKFYLMLLLLLTTVFFGQCLLFLVEDEDKACQKKTCSFHLKNRNLKPGGNSLNYWAWGAWGVHLGAIWVFGERKRRLEDAKPLKALHFLQLRSGSKLPEPELLEEDSSSGHDSFGRSFFSPDVWAKQIGVK